jgi:hypothetical protein
MSCIPMITPHLLLAPHALSHMLFTEAQGVLESPCGEDPIMESIPQGVSICALTNEPESAVVNSDSSRGR